MIEELYAKITDETRDNIAKLLEYNVPYSDIAKILNTSQTTVSNIAVVIKFAKKNDWVGLETWAKNNRNDAAVKWILKKHGKSFDTKTNSEWIKSMTKIDALKTLQKYFGKIAGSPDMNWLSDFIEMLENRLTEEEADGRAEQTEE